MNILSGNPYNRTNLKSVLIITGILFLIIGYYLLRLYQDSKYLYKERSKKEKNNEKKKIGYLYIKNGKLTMTREMKFLTSEKLFVYSLILILSGGLLISFNFFRSAE